MYVNATRHSRRAYGGPLSWRCCHLASTRPSPQPIGSAPGVRWPAVGAGQATTGEVIVSTALSRRRGCVLVVQAVAVSASARSICRAAPVWSPRRREKRSSVPPWAPHPTIRSPSPPAPCRGASRRIGSASSQRMSSGCGINMTWAHLVLACSTLTARALHDPWSPDRRKVRSTDETVGRPPPIESPALL